MPAQMFACMLLLLKKRKFAPKSCVNHMLLTLASILLDIAALLILPQPDWVPRSRASCVIVWYNCVPLNCVGSVGVGMAV
jgi:hypothetical protein